ncbi:MAG: anti-sigma factor, partial [Propionibacteriaceae bacterium]
MHVDEDLLTLLALGEPAGTSDERDHVASCAECTAELAELRRVVGLARSGETLEVPGPRVWAAVRAGLGTPASGEATQHAEPRA